MAMRKKDETWMNVENYEGFYKVSDLGRVKSLDRKYAPKERILKAGINSHGYLVVSLLKNSVKKTSKVHQLVAMAFLGHKPNGHKLVVDHIDNDKLNNNLDNLQITTTRHNTSKDRVGGSSKYIGVSWSKSNKKWQAQIRINGKVEPLGHFVNEIDAAKAYQSKLKKEKL